jgi:putative hydrolase of the HAD superfamily
MRDFPGMLGKRPEKFMPLYMEKLLARLDITLDPKSFTEHWMRHWNEACARWKPYENVREVLGRLRGSGIRTGIISNWDPTARDVLKTCCLEDLLDPVIVSCEVGAAKPSEKIFRIALEKAGVEPSRCLYVGDNYYDDAAGAAKVGMKAVIINRFGDFGVEELSGQPIVRDISGIFSYLEGKAS